MVAYLGLDLAGSERRATGYAVIENGSLVALGIVRTNEEIFKLVDFWKPSIIAIDSPLSINSFSGFRTCDLKLKKMGISAMPLNTPGMKMLIERALVLKEKFVKRNIEVIETFPYASLRILGYEKKPKNMSNLAKLAKEILYLFDIRRDIDFHKLRVDEFDAILCALAAFSYALGDFTAIEDDQGCRIILLRYRNY